MKKKLYYILLIGFFFSCNFGSSDTLNVEKKISKDNDFFCSDTIFLGFIFGMSEEEFLSKAENLRNKKKLEFDKINKKYSYEMKIADNLYDFHNGMEYIEENFKLNLEPSFSKKNELYKLALRTEDKYFNKPVTSANLFPLQNYNMDYLMYQVLEKKYNANETNSYYKYRDSTSHEKLSSINFYGYDKYLNYVIGKKWKFCNKVISTSHNTMYITEDNGKRRINDAGKDSLYYELSYSDSIRTVKQNLEIENENLEIENEKKGIIKNKIKKSRNTLDKDL